MVGDGFSDYKASVKTNLHFVARNIPEQEAFWQEQEIRYIVDDLISFPSLLGLI
jgi:hypothetical protein